VRDANHAPFFFAEMEHLAEIIPEQLQQTAILQSGTALIEQRSDHHARCF
jgi:hypothetical protein